MSVFTWLWIAWAATFVGVEGTALVIHAYRGTLTWNVMWLITGVGPWHRIARISLIALLAWLPFHFGLPGTDWSSVWPNLVASIIWAVPTGVIAVRGYLAHHRKALAEHHETLVQRIKAELKLSQNPEG